MSEAKPGPWEWRQYPDAGWENKGPDLQSVSLAKAWDEYWGPDRNGPDDDPKRERMPPSPTILSAWGYDAWGITVDPEDARLIAAAPELLAACREALGAIENSASPAIDCLLQAIAKAEGQR